jgi:hypothetical protein
VYSNFITESNAERLANALCRMRGAALKIGQMLSIQDETVLPPQVRPRVHSPHEDQGQSCHVCSACGCA